MRILVACEESQRVTIELRKLGHEAYSCDLVECTGGHPEWHIQCDATKILGGRTLVQTIDGELHEIPGRWDMIIAHPPCTFLSNVAGKYFSLRCMPAEKVVHRWKKRAEAAILFMHFVLADCPRIAVENPIGFMNAAYRKPNQIIHPYMFAESETDKENYVTKATCLWLKGLPLLRKNDLPKPDNGRLFGYFPSGKAKTWEDSYAHGSTERSKTFPGVAKAMAEQWAGLVDHEGREH